MSAIPTTLTLTIGQRQAEEIAWRLEVNESTAGLDPTDVLPVWGRVDGVVLGKLSTLTVWDIANAVDDLDSMTEVYEDVIEFEGRDSSDGRDAASNLRSIRAIKARIAEVSR